MILSHTDTKWRAPESNYAAIIKPELDPVSKNVRVQSLIRHFFLPKSWRSVNYLFCFSHLSVDPLTTKLFHLDLHDYWKSWPFTEAIEWLIALIIGEVWKESVQLKPGDIAISPCYFLDGCSETTGYGQGVNVLTFFFLIFFFYYNLCGKDGR